MTKNILLTRPRASSERWASLLAARGFDCLIEPLLEIEPTHAPRPSGAFQAIVLTSANAPETLPPNAIADLLTLPCFCVGAATAEAARLYGFTDIKCGMSDSAALANIIVTTLKDKTTPLLHIRGDITDSKADDILDKNGFTLTPWVIYRARAVNHFSATTRACFAAGDIAVIPVFSPRSARLLVEVIEKNGLTQACYRISVLGLSQAVADVLKLLPWRRLRVAASPTADDVIASLQTEIFMAQTETKIPSLPPAPGKRKRGGFMIGMVLLAGAGSVAIVKCPFFVPPQPPPANTALLEKRIANLETKLNTLTEIPAPVPADPALADTVRNLQNEVAQIQSVSTQNQQAAHQWVAAAFAFWDLREAAHAGRPFTAPFATLRKMSNNPVVAEQAVLLESFAASPPPPLAQLKEELMTSEASITAPTVTQAAPTWRDKIKAALGTLVVVHPLHNPSFADVEKALDSGTAQDALDAFRFLPEDTQHQLTDWKSKLEARVAVDNAVAALGISFTAPAPTEAAP